MTLNSSFQKLPFFFLIFSLSCISATCFLIPRLGVVPRRIGHESVANSIVEKDLKTCYYNQTLDHFNYRPESYTTFKQRYILNFKYWGGADVSAPIFVYFGEEADLDEDLPINGFLPDNASQFNALLLYIEHRYYGKSFPFGSMEEATANASMLGYFNSAQAIADYAAIIMNVKKNLNAHNSPVIVIGGSYGGMLASWFRLKYPHIALGALASSAPILYFDDITPQNGYYSIVTKDFKEASESCYQTINRSWHEIDKVTSQPNGLSILTKRFNACSLLNASSELKDYLDSMYSEAAQYNEPPKYPVTVVCGGIDGAASKGGDTIDSIFGGVVLTWEKGHATTLVSIIIPLIQEVGGHGSEMVMPIGGTNNDTMFPPHSFNLTTFINSCKQQFRVIPRPHWITTYYGGHDIGLVLHRFASNIIFSNGLRDPYSCGGVLKNISESVVSVYTVNGSHCLDLYFAKKSDPQWLINQRKIEVDIIHGWISNYYNDLLVDNTMFLHSNG